MYLNKTGFGDVL